MLDFHGPRRKRGETVEVVWRAELPSFWSMRSARVEYSKDFGWVLVVRLVHEEAKRLLTGVSWPDYVAGGSSPFEPRVQPRTPVGGIAWPGATE
jgi:hypothetical protein